MLAGRPVPISVGPLHSSGGRREPTAASFLPSSEKAFLGRGERSGREGVKVGGWEWPWGSSGSRGSGEGSRGCPQILSALLCLKALHGLL